MLENVPADAGEKQDLPQAGIRRRAVKARKGFFGTTPWRKIGLQGALLELALLGFWWFTGYGPLLVVVVTWGLAAPLITLLAWGIQNPPNTRSTCNALLAALAQNNPDLNDRELLRAYRRLLSLSHSKSNCRFIECMEHSHGARIMMAFDNGAEFRILRNGDVVPRTTTSTGRQGSGSGAIQTINDVERTTL